jgi:SnoaL-like domain
MDSHTLDSHNLEQDLPSGAEDPRGLAAESQNVQAVKDAFKAFTDAGAEAGLEALVAISHRDCRFRPPSADGRVLDGHDELRAYYREVAEAGTSVRVRARSFKEEQRDEVVVSGSIRIVHPDASFAERQMRWIYRFRDGLVEEADWSPRHPA